MKKVVFTFGRMNPPTVGHQKLVDKVKAEAKKQSADAHIYLSHTQNKKKDPLDYNTKVKYATKAFGSVVTKTTAKTIIQVLTELQSAGYTDVTLVVGSDRIPEFKKLLTKYNGKDYQFNSINFISAGQRDPDAEGVSGMSASKMRALAMEGDLATFKSGLPKALQASAKEIYNKLRNIMEEDDNLEESLSLQQRQKRSRIMKRLSKKIAIKRNIQKKRMADGKRLQRRALKKAREIVRKRVAGEKGAKYASLSAGQKMTIDKMVEKKKGLILKIAKKLLPRVRKQEVQRLQKARGGANMSNKQIYGTTRKEELEMDNTTLNERIDPRKEPNLFRALTAIEKEKQRDLQKFDRMRDTARVRDTIYRNRKEDVNEGGEAADFGNPDAMDQERKSGNLGKSVPVPGHYKDKGVKSWKDMPKLKVQDENPPSGLRLAHLTVKGEKNLREKAERNGIEFEELMSVYENAVIDSNSNNTEEQQRFQAVNHYIAEGPLVMTRNNAVKTLVRIADDQVNKMNDNQLKTFAQVLGKSINKQATGKYVVEEKDGLEDACWKGYEAIGTKKKNGKTVPNCVPKEEAELEEDINTTIDLNKILNKLNKRAKDAIIMRFKYNMTFAHMGKEFGVSTGRAREIFLKALRDLRNQPNIAAFKKHNNPLDNALKKMKEEAQFDEATSISPLQKARMDKEKADRNKDKEKETQANRIKKKTYAGMMGGLKEGESAQPAVKKTAYAKHPRTGNTFNPFSPNDAGKTTGQAVTPNQSPRGGRALTMGEAKVPHVLDPKKSLKHMMKDVGVDVDADGDVDILDKMVKRVSPESPDEVTGTEKKTKDVQKFWQKTRPELEKKHTKVGVAYEAVSPEKDKKRLKDILPKSGAGQEGTDELVKTYLAQTPGMTIEEGYTGMGTLMTAKDLGIEAQGGFAYHPSVEEFVEEYEDWGEIDEAAEYQGKKVKLNNPFRLPSGSKKKFGVYVKNDKGNVVKVTFGDPNMEIKRDDPARRKAFRSRHSCDDDRGPKWKARYWSCFQWRAGKKVDN